MADISQIEIEGTTYNIKDTVARASSGGGGDTPNDITKIYDTITTSSSTKVYSCHGTKKSVYRLIIQATGAGGGTGKSSLNYKMHPTASNIPVITNMTGSDDSIQDSAKPFVVAECSPTSDYPSNNMIFEFIVLPGGSITVTTSVNNTVVNGIEYIYN